MQAALRRSLGQRTQDQTMSRQKRRSHQSPDQRQSHSRLKRNPAAVKKMTRVVRSHQMMKSKSAKGQDLVWGLLEVVALYIYVCVANFELVPLHAILV